MLRPPISSPSPRREERGGPFTRSRGAATDDQAMALSAELTMRAASRPANRSWSSSEEAGRGNVRQRAR